MTPLEEKLTKDKNELVDVIRDVKMYLTQRVLNMTEYNDLLVKVNKALKKSALPPGGRE